MSAELPTASTYWSKILDFDFKLFKPQPIMVLDCIPHTRCSFTDNILPNCSPHDLKVTIHHIKPSERMILFWQTLSVSGRRSFLFSCFSHQLYTFSVQICLVRYVSLSSSGHISNNLSSLSTVHQTHKLHQLSSQQFKNLLLFLSAHVT